MCVLCAPQALSEEGVSLETVQRMLDECDRDNDRYERGSMAANSRAQQQLPAVAMRTALRLTTVHLLSPPPEGASTTRSLRV
jgi:hypothetical protein